MPAKKYTLGKVGVSTDEEDITLPSGATCRARRLGFQGMVDAGLLDNFDSLTAIVQTEHIGPNTGGIAGQPKATEADVQRATAEMIANKDKMSAAIELMDRVTAYVVVEPKVWINYQLTKEADADFDKRVEEAKKAEAIPVQAIGEVDKMHLLQWSMGGTADIPDALAAFR